MDSLLIILKGLILTAVTEVFPNVVLDWESWGFVAIIGVVWNRTMRGGYER